MYKPSWHIVYRWIAERRTKSSTCTGVWYQFSIQYKKHATLQYEKTWQIGRCTSFSFHILLSWICDLQSEFSTCVVNDNANKAALSFLFCRSVAHVEKSPKKCFCTRKNWHLTYRWQRCGFGQNKWTEYCEVDYNFELSTPTPLSFLDWIWVTLQRHIFYISLMN